MTDEQLKQGKEIKEVIGKLEREIENFDNVTQEGINVFLPNVGSLISDVRQLFLIQRDKYNKKFKEL